MAYKFRLKVRDYECDMQGIVNNAVYQNYLEAARHEFMISRGVDFAELTRQGTILVVVRAELDYRQPLRSQDLVDISVKVTQYSRLKILFEQTIVRVADQQLMLEAKVFGAAMKDYKKPFFPQELKALF